MNRLTLALSPLAALAALAALGCEAAEDSTTPSPVTPGGDTTVVDRTSVAYSKPAPNLVETDLEKHLAGDLTFEAQFVTPPAEINPGLGPTYNNVSCARCHIRDGRGMPAVGNGPLRSQLLVRVSLPTGAPDVPGGAVPVPGLGAQIQDQAIFGETPEAKVEVDWETVPGTFGDGTAYALRRPVLRITLPDGTPLPADAQTSLRQPPPVFGLGLLEAVAEADIRALADPDDADGDGISGRVNEVWDPEVGGAVLGRFGHKANTSNLRIQAAAAYFNDMGVSSPVFGDADGHTDIGETELAATVFYTQTLAVPAPAAPTTESKRGEALFGEFGCVACHVDALETGEHAISALAHQAISPYTDLLLHDMGDDLADGRPDFRADGREWRTAPLWGIGLTHTVLPYSGFLHDGRARTLDEAILWHGGEAEKAREAFRNASATDRAALMAFLLSL